jgi:hypothetical protein
VTSPLVPLHIAPYAESLATAYVWTLEWLLASMRVAVDSKAARSAERLVASLADVAILVLRIPAV